MAFHNWVKSDLTDAVANSRKATAIAIEKNDIDATPRPHAGAAEITGDRTEVLGIKAPVTIKDGPDIREHLDTVTAAIESYGVKVAAWADPEEPGRVSSVPLGHLEGHPHTAGAQRGYRTNVGY